MTGVSVIMPTLNMGHFIPDAIASIVRQSRSVTEVIIVDCGSTDGTSEIVARLHQDGAPVLFTESEASSPGQARNEGIAAARGDIVAFLDADDLWPEGKLARQLDYLDAFPNKGMVSGFVRYFDVLDPLTLAPAQSSRVETLFHVHPGACLYRRAVIDQLGAFDESLLYSEDVDLILRLREAEIDFTILRGIMLFCRRHGDSMMSREHPRKRGDFRRAVAMSVARRRASGKPPIDLNLFETFFESVP